VSGCSQYLYDISPHYIQTFLLNVFALQLHWRRFGKKLEGILKWLEETEKWSYDELVSYQEEKLRSLISHAYSTVPFYHERMKAVKVAPDDIKKITDLAKLPVLTKDEVKRNLEKLISTVFKKKDLIHGHTSGTTGSPLDLYWDHGMVLMNNAFDWRQKRWAGFSVGDPHAVILGRVVVPIRKKTPPFWQMNYIQNQLWLSAFHMSDSNLEYYIGKMEKFKPKFVEGYPSTLYILAQHLIGRQRRLSLGAVISSAETLFPYQMEAIEKAFECKMFDFYGMAERVTFATECPMHDGKHVNMEYGITEIVDEAGNPCDLGVQGKLVGTSLHNFGMPFIRYQTSDVTALKKGKCPCGLNHPLMESITTKFEDIVITPEGKWISPSVLTHPFKPQKNIVESQIIQERIDLVRIRIVKNERFSLEDERELLKSLHERLGDKIRITLDFVQEIPREKSGKFRWVISRVTEENPIESGEPSLKET
jgi:phenylacetate-CoA ligase